MLRARLADRPMDRTWMAWVLGSLTWMVNGISVLGDNQVPAELAKRYQKLPEVLLTSMFTCQMGLFARIEKAMSAVPVFCLEDLSRMMWAQIGSRRFSCPEVTGVPGSEMLGMNGVQKMWLAYNEIEDRRIEQETNWRHAKFVASAQSPKGVKKIEMQDQLRLKRELNARQEEKDRFYYQCIGVVGEDDKLEDGRARHKESKSPGELADEYQRWVSGDMDEHDRIIAAYKNAIMENYEAENQRRQEQIAMMHALPVEQMSEETFPEQPIVAYDLDSLSDMLKGRKPGSSLPGARRLYEDKGVGRAKGYWRLQQKQAAPPEGGLAVKDGKVVAPGGPGSLSLQEEIQKRTPRFGAKPTSGGE